MRSGTCKAAKRSTQRNQTVVEAPYIKWLEAAKDIYIRIDEK